MTLDEWRHDLELAGRGLLRAKGFAAAAALTLAVGIAGTTVMFALVEGVLLRPLPVPDQDSLIVAWNELRTGGSRPWPFRARDLDAIAKATGVLETVAGVSNYDPSVGAARVAPSRRPLTRTQPRSAVRSRLQSALLSA